MTFPSPSTTSLRIPPSGLVHVAIASDGKVRVAGLAVVPLPVAVLISPTNATGAKFHAAPPGRTADARRPAKL